MSTKVWTMSGGVISDNMHSIQEALLWRRECAMHLSVEILQLQNIPIVWHYLRDPSFSRFYTIPECDRHTDTLQRHIPRLARRRAVKIGHFRRKTRYNTKTVQDRRIVSIKVE